MHFSVKKTESPKPMVEIHGDLEDIKDDFTYKEITPRTQEEIKEIKIQYKHRRFLFDCIFENSKKCQDSMKDNLKMHYLTHFQKEGNWDHVIQLQGEDQINISSYQCNA